MPQPTPTSAPFPFAPLFQPALEILRRAYQYAADVGLDPWQFSLELPGLRTAGLDNADIQWLLHKRYLQHAYECSVPTKALRQFRFTKWPRRFTQRSCFVLSEAGLELVPAQPLALDELIEEANRAKRPKYHADIRELWFQGEKAKWFRTPAGNQELILLAFEEEGWPHFMDDPLPPLPDIVPSRRLGHAIRRLNGNIKGQLRFHGNGDGRGLRWEPWTGGQPETGARRPARTSQR